jgi:signal transduction histidine kinase
MSAATKAILQHEEDSRRELHQLRLIASTSSLVLIFAHEVRQLLGLISANVSTLENVSRQLTGEDRQNVIHLQEEMDETRERFSDLLEMTSLVGVDGQSASPKRLAVKPCISRTIKCYKLIISRRNVEIDIADIPNKTIVGPMIEAELYAIFLNVLSNSIKSVIAKGRNRKIKISASRVGGRTHICVTDTGVGLDSQHFEDVFLPFVADPESVLYRGLKKNLDSKDQEFVGGGSGLGLSIVKQIVESRRGEIAFRNPPEGWSSKLEIILP